MKRLSVFLYIFLIVISCEKEDDNLGIDNNPFKDRIEYNGLEIDNVRYETPNAFLEIWGSNDSLSSNFDGYLTDGNYEKLINPPKVKDYSILVYFDLNSPSLTKLAPGTYLFVNSNERIPGIFNAASHIRIILNNKTEQYNITSGTITVEENKGYILLEYELVLNKAFEVSGQFTGLLDLKLPY